MQLFTRPGKLIFIILPLLLVHRYCLYAQPGESSIRKTQAIRSGIIHSERAENKLVFPKSQNKISGNPILNFPVDSCFTYTYKLKAGAPSNTASVNKSFTAADGTTYLVGHTTNTAGVRSGLLQRLDYKGNIILSKSIELNGRFVTIKSITQQPDSRLYLIGTTSLSDGSDKKILILAADTAGALLWNKSLSLTGYEGKGIIADENQIGATGFCGSDDSTLIFGKLDNTAGLVWIRKVQLMKRGAAIDMSSYLSTWHISYTGSDSSRHAGMLLWVNSVFGSVDRINKFGGAASNSDFIIHHSVITNLRPKLTGIYSQNNGPYKFFRITMDPTSNGIELFLTFDLPGVTIDTTSSSAINPWAQVISLLPQNTGAYLYAFKPVNDSYPDTLIHWAKRFSNNGINEISSSERAFDGGFFITGNNATETILLKTDSTGLIKNCEGENFEIHTTGINGPPLMAAYKLSSSPPALTETSSFNVNNAAVSFSYECKSLSCPVRPAEDSCLTGFSRRYRSADYCELGFDMVADNQNTITAVGLTRDYMLDPSTEKTFIARLSSTGKLLERKKINFGSLSVFGRVKYLADGNLLLTGSSSHTSPFSNNDTSYISIVKMTAAYDLIWQKSFPVYGPYSATYGAVESDDGSIFINYVEGTAFCMSVSLLKLDGTGNLIWLKKYNAPGTCFFGYVGSVTQDQDNIYMINFEAGNPGMILFKISKSSGTPVWAKGYNIAGADQCRIGRDLYFTGSKLAVQGTVSGSSWSKSVIMLLDTAGTVLKSRYFQKDGYGLEYRMAVLQNSQFVLNYGNYNETSFIRLDSSLEIINCKRTQLPKSYFYKSMEGQGGGVYNIGYGYDNDPYTAEMVLNKLTPDGLAGSCFTDTLELNTAPENIITTTVIPSVATAGLQMYSLPYKEYTYSLQENALLCKRLPDCDTLGLLAPIAACDTLPHTITAVRRRGCMAIPVFTYDTSYVKELSRTDSSITVKFLKSGATYIKGKIYTGCQWIPDSVLINISLTNSVFSLGPDTTLCEGNSMILNAHSGYAVYHWSNGSADSMITIFQPGIYYVDVTDACGRNSSDTIKIDPGPFIQVNIGQDRFKCNNDTLHLSASPGFLNYYWGPNYNISSLTAQQVIVQPLIDTVYFVKAEKTPGCFGYDTVRIAVFSSPPVLLGPDKSICAADSLLLDAGAGFSQYLWNTGAITSKITVRNTGDYIVSASTDKGCISKDTIHVNTWLLPVINLNKDSTLCNNSSRQLNAGGSFTDYTWQDGSHQSYLSIYGRGKYYVTVTDLHGCKGSDTVNINTILPLPQSFLPPDTTICGYSQLIVKANGSYNSYLWSTGATVSSITVSRAGIYSLKVSDSRNCQGTDTIIVKLKDCVSGLFVPNAFTPDNNGLNDKFKPFIGGVVKQYEFFIYNRYGEVVFQTRTLNEGWDGTVRGIQQNGGGFVWVCKYQLEGNSPQTAKGYFLLIR